MTRISSRRRVAYLGLAATGLLAGLAIGRVELVALAAPFALAAVVGAALARDPELTATLALDRERALEGEEVQLTLELRSRTGASRVDLLLELSTGLRTLGPNPQAVRVRPGVPRVLELPLRCERWGAHAIG